MPRRKEISEEQKSEIQVARRVNKNKRVDARLRVLELCAEGKTNEEIGTMTGYHPSRVSHLISAYHKEGLSAFTENKYGGNRKNMSYEEEEAILAPFRERARRGEMVSVAEIAVAYQQKVAHTVGANQIYFVLRRHGWRKVMPRSRHPKKASEEVIATSKKLTLE